MIWKKLVEFLSMSLWKLWRAIPKIKSITGQCITCSRNMTEKAKDSSPSMISNKWLSFWTKKMTMRCYMRWLTEQVKLKSSRSHISNFTSSWQKQSIDSLQFIALTIENMNQWMINWVSHHPNLTLLLSILRLQSS